MSTYAGLPVPGYKPQNDTRIALVTVNKFHEERALRTLDDLARDGVWDPRMLAIGRTYLETAWMWINRSIFQPGRAELPDDEEPNGLELAARWHEQQAAEYEQAGTEADLAQAEHHRRYAREVRDIDAKKVGAATRSRMQLIANVLTPLGDVLSAGLVGTVVDLPPTVDPAEASARGLIPMQFALGTPGPLTTFLIPRDKVGAVDGEPKINAP